MTFRIREATTEKDWEQATVLLRRIYVGGSYTTDEQAARFMTRANLEPAGVLLVAMDATDAVIGAVLLLHPESPLRQVAAANEREFRVLGVDDRTRGNGIGERLALRESL